MVVNAATLACRISLLYFVDKTGNLSLCFRNTMRFDETFKSISLDGLYWCLKISRIVSEPRNGWLKINILKANGQQKKKNIL